jgi:hypothetical protein
MLWEYNSRNDIVPLYRAYCILGSAELGASTVCHVWKKTLQAQLTQMFQLAKKHAMEMIKDVIELGFH